MQVLGPLGRPFVPVDPPAEAWMVAGGVGLAPFATLAEALAARGTRMRLFYGARSARISTTRISFAALGASLHLTTEDGSRGERGPHHGAARTRARRTPSAAAVTIYACGPTPMMRAVAELGAVSRTAGVRVARAGHGLRHGRLLQLRRARPPRRRQSFRALVPRRPGVRRRAIVWDALGAGH